MNDVAPSHKRDWGKGGTLLVIAVVLLALPDRFTLGGPIVSYSIGLIFAATCVSSFVTTAIGAQKWANGVMKVGVFVLAVSILASVVQVLVIMFGGSAINGVALLETALSIWVSNVAIFAMLYHTIGEREFLFPHRDGDPPAQYVFLDYLFLSFTTATAFSPTDTAPLSTRTRMMIMVESAISLMMIALAAARAVNILT
ncbi:MAG TPA: hypothetical protein VK760_05960 [Candidatus Acidoferrales bacterium]|nr:hypothetical protein [Candidatus Acidoferrales bacterium]